jgi:hypothetical protein
VSGGRLESNPMTGTAESVTVIEPGSDEERELRGEWLSRLMFGWMLQQDLAYVEDRSYEDWLAARGLSLG